MVAPLHTGPDPAALQARLLPGVSRSFALAIPQLPKPLDQVVANAYLLCRIADTIEDHPGLDLPAKRTLLDLFLATLDGTVPAAQFAATLHPLLGETTPPAERDLVAEAEHVIGMTTSFTPRQREILRQHVGIMCRGMPEFQGRGQQHGLPDLTTLDRYCYVVAGVVGEMLTELYCDYSPEIAARHAELAALARSFGQGLQMTNILKDLWDDHRLGTCWLPRDVFAASGYDLDRLDPVENRGGFNEGLAQLIGITHRHLRDALDYTLLLPRQEIAIRRFCLWSIGLALFTLRRIHASPEYASGEDVKVKRAIARRVMAACNLATSNDTLLRLMFSYAARGLPAVIKPSSGQ
ncbi:MAG: phytoene/squalene synthase family protein [Steroidobacteraceae bacterium]